MSVYSYNLWTEKHGFILQLLDVTHSNPLPHPIVHLHQPPSQSLISPAFTSHSLKSASFCFFILHEIKAHGHESEGTRLNLHPYSTLKLCHPTSKDFGCLKIFIAKQHPTKISTRPMAGVSYSCLCVCTALLSWWDLSQLQWPYHVHVIRPWSTRNHFQCHLKW